MTNPGPPPGVSALSDESFAMVRSHFEACPLPPDAGCAPCDAFEKERRRRCHGSIARCAEAHSSDEPGGPR